MWRRTLYVKCVIKINVMAILTRIQATLCNFNFAIDIKEILPLLLVAIFLHKRTFGKEVEDLLMIFFFKKNTKESWQLLKKILWFEYLSISPLVAIVITKKLKVLSVWFVPHTLRMHFGILFRRRRIVSSVSKNIWEKLTSSTGDNEFEIKYYFYF